MLVKCQKKTDSQTSFWSLYSALPTPMARLMETEEAGEGDIGVTIQYQSRKSRRSTIAALSAKLSLNSITINFPVASAQQTSVGSRTNGIWPQYPSVFASLYMIISFERSNCATTKDTNMYHAQRTLLT